MRTFCTGIVLSLAVFVFSVAAQAAFIVEPASSGKAHDHFTYQDGSAASFSSAAGHAAGLTATQSAYGGNGATVDRYIFSYTPGADADNTTFTTGQVLGDTRIDPPGDPSGVSAEPQTATGLVGGGSGTYKVYITWPASGNVDASGSTITVASDGSPIVLNPVGQNNSGANISVAGSGGADKWLLIGTVDLTTGNTYTVTQQANSIAFVSQRSAGVMWELQPEAVPEPATIALFGLACLGFVGTRRRA